MKIYDRFVHEQKARKVRNIIKKYNLSLVRAICSRMNYVMAVGIDLLDINVIPERMYTEFSKTVNNSDPVTDMIFASSLMSRVRKTLYEDPDCFPVIMNAFRKHSLLNEVVVLMEKEYYGRSFLASKSFIVFLVSFLVGIMAVFIMYFMWPSSTVVHSCSEVDQQKILLKLLTSNVSNLTDCLSQHEEGTKLLQHYQVWCNQTKRINISTTEATDADPHWCTIVDTIYSKLNLAKNFTVEDERTWCQNDIALLLECLK